MDEATQKAVEKIEKLMRLAGKNPNEAEAASALAKAQELLVAYNLDMAVIEQSAGAASGKRLEEMVSGGMHRYQRSLWQHIAQLNFCMHWTQLTRVKEGSVQAKRGRRKTHEHRLVGRTVNVASTKGMAFYLDQTIERLCREMLGSERSMQYYSRDAVAFREGVADRVIEKIVERRNDLIKQEKNEAAKKAREAAAAGVSLAKTLTIATLSEREKEANDDFLYGEGYTARRKAADAEWEAGREERRAQRAAASAAAEQAEAEWAAAHPEEAKKEAARERARERAREKRQANGSGRRWRFRETAEDHRRGSDAYHSGYAKGEGVSIDQQVDTGSKTRRLT